MKKFLILLLAFILVFGSACTVEYVQESPSAGVEDVEPPVDEPPIDDEPVVEGPLPAYVEYPEAEIKPVRQFDRDEVYDHVFFNRSRLLTDEEFESLDPNYSNGEAVVLFGFTERQNSLSYTEYDAYFLTGISSENSGNCSKYLGELPSFGTGTGNSSIIYHDYHEAYLDVLFENLTFSVCEKLPAYEDGYYEIGSFASKEAGAEAVYDNYKNYRYFYTDGYMYYAVKGEDGVKTYYKSDVKVDIAYLSFIFFNSSKYNMNNTFKNEYGLEFHYNIDFDIEEPYEELSFTDLDGNTHSYLKMQSGKCYYYVGQINNYLRQGNGYAFTTFYFERHTTFYDMRGLNYLAGFNNLI